MLDLGNGRIYINEGEPLPYICFGCGHPVPYTKAPFVVCPSCGKKGCRSDFGDTDWQFQEPN